MNHELPFFDPGIPIPVLEPRSLLSSEWVEFGRFSQKQREWFKRRDTDPITHLVRCQFQGKTSSGRWNQCPVNENTAGRGGLHCHHLVPAGWFKRWLKGLSDDPHERTENYPENGLILCLAHHNGPRGIHPDYAEALNQYRKGHKDAFREVAEMHTQMENMELPYWNQMYDRMLINVACDRTEEYMKDNPMDLFPYDKYVT